MYFIRWESLAATESIVFNSYPVDCGEHGLQPKMRITLRADDKLVMYMRCKCVHSRWVLRIDSIRFRWPKEVYPLANAEGGIARSQRSHLAEGV